MTAFHQSFFTVVLLYNAFMAIWGLGLFFLRRNPSGSYLGALAIDEAVALVQGIAGLILILQGHRPHDALHYLYGVVLAITLPFAYFYGDNGTSRRDSLIFGIAAAFLVGIAIRSATTGKA